MKRHWLVIALTAVVVAMVDPVQAAQPPAGLEKVKVKRLDAVYSKPGTDWAQYSGIYVAPLDLSEAKIKVPSGTHKRDVPAMTEERSALFQELFQTAFTRELSEDGLFVTEAAAKSAGLILKAKVLEIAPTYIPNSRMEASGRNAAYAETAGKMTLQFDFIDGKSGQLLARVIDQREPTRRWRELTPVEVRSQVNQIMGSWARIIRTHLEDLIRPQGE